MAVPPKILLVEDDVVQAEWIGDQIAQHLSNENLLDYLKYFDSERKFIEAVPLLQQWGPEIALIDRSIRYLSVDDVRAGISQFDFKNLPDPHTAWVRCRDALLKTCPKVRVAILTVHDSVPGANASDVVIQKGGDAMTTKLGQFLRQTTLGRR